MQTFLHKIQEKGADMSRTAIYVRQSAERADSVSLETQEQLCRQETAPEDAVTVFCDRGFSGKNTARPGLQAMMQAVRSGQIDRVLVYKLDRISRNLADFTQILRDFQRYGTAFQSHTEHFETASPMGQAMQNMLMVFAELERETICARVRDAAFSRAKRGFDTGGPPPAGFRRVPAVIGGIHTSMLEADAHAADIQAGFAHYCRAEGTVSAVCRLWTDMGFQPVRGKTWATGTVSRMLRNPVYVQADSQVYAYLAKKGAELCVPAELPAQHGVYIYADRRLTSSRLTDLHGMYAICAPHEGLIAPALWLACQEKMDRALPCRRSGTKPRSFLSGLLYCMRCGSAMTPVQGRSAIYLVCSGKKRGICEGAGAVWRLEEAERLVGAVLAARLETLRKTGVIRQQDDRTRSLHKALERTEMRRRMLLQSITEADDADVMRAAAEAAAQMEHTCTKLRQQIAAAGKHEAVNLPEWAEADAGFRCNAAKILLEYVLTDGKTLHTVLR